jgi:uncharacterized protein (TIGR02996 family)
MSDEAALLAAIREHPEDDVPRLAYADWLEEQGGESNTDRAEYIRLEMQLARDFPEMRWSPEKQKARKRARQLFAKHYREWFPELFGRKNILRGARAYPDMSRGFPYKVQGRSNKLVSVGERLAQLAPIVELHLLDMSNSDLGRFVGAEWVRGLRKVSLSGRRGSAEPNFAPLADGEHFAELRDLAIVFGWLDRARAARIAAANPFPKLERFRFGADSSDDAPAALFGGTAFTGLRHLTLFGGRQLGNSPMPRLKAMCASRALDSLRSLDLHCRPTTGLAALLTGSAFWHGLEELDLLRNNLGDRDLAQFLKKPTKLRKLELAANKITAKGAKHLAEHPAFANITDLDLTGNPIGDAGLTALVQSPHARNLQRLRVSTCGFGLAGITALAESPHMANLRELWMHSNDIGLKGIRALCASPHLRGLTYLYFGSTTATGKKVLKARFGKSVSC